MGASCWALASLSKAETSELTWVTWLGKHNKWLSPRGTPRAPLIPAIVGLLFAALTGILSTWKQRNNSLSSWPFARQLCVHLSLSSVEAHVWSVVSVLWRPGSRKSPRNQAHQLLLHPPPLWPTRSTCQELPSLLLLPHSLVWWLLAQTASVCLFLHVRATALLGSSPVSTLP